MVKVKKGGKKEKKNDNKGSDVSAGPSNDASNLLGSILQESNTSTTRRSLFRNEGEDFIVDIEHDAEREKAERREQENVEEEKKKAASSAPKPSLLSTMTPQEIENHYSRCIQMCMQNKVNPKNAFKLQLIDYMKLVMAKRSTQCENLSLMSCTLDASAKIYSHRVDKVYTDMLKILSNKDSKPSKDDEESGDEGSESAKGSAKEGEEKKSSEVEDSILLQNLRTNNDSSQDELSDNELDDFSEKVLNTHESFDRGPIEQDYYGFKLPKNQEYFLESEMSSEGYLRLNGPLFEVEEPSSFLDNKLTSLGPAFNGEVGLSEIGSLIPGYGEILKKYHIIDEEKLEKSSFQNSKSIDPTDDMMSEEMLRQIDNSINEEDNRSMGDGGGTVNECLDYDDIFEEDIPIGELPSVGVDRSLAQSIGKRATSFTVDGMSRLVASKSNDYSYFDSNKLTFWAGPTHWKPVRNKEVIKRSTEGKHSKKEVTLKFSSELYEKLAKHFEGNVNATLAKKTMMTWSKSKLFFPPEITNLKKKCHCLFHLDKYSVIRRRSSDETEQESSKDLTVKDSCMMPTDYLEGCEGGEMEEDNMDRDDHLDNTQYSASDANNSQLDMFTDSRTEIFNNQSLIPAPPKVNKIFINYAKVQKRIDIKLVKQTMWDAIQSSENKENSIQLEKTGEERSGETGDGGEVKLSTIYDQLRNNLPEETKAQLSFPIAFMSLLHLANEKCLSLSGNNNESDITVLVDLIK